MLDILRNMIKEEWRIHSVMFGGMMFFFFPILLIIFTFFGSMLLPVISIIIPTIQLVVLTHYLFVLFGVSIGSFGLFGREVMNRRFGQASLIAYSSRSLPVSERKLFASFFVKDIIYYFFLWILPFMLGFALAVPMLSFSFAQVLTLMLTLTLSFMTGLSTVFFLSTLYAHSGKGTVLFIAVVITALLGLNYIGSGMLPMIPSLAFFFMPSYFSLSVSLLLIILPITVSVLWLKIDYPEKKRRFRNSLDSLAEKIPFRQYSWFISKDFLDLSRSEGGPGKIIFSFLFPLAIIFPMLMVFLEFIPVANFLVVFSIFLGVISSTIYNWLTEFDLFTSYAFLPVKISTLIKGKLRGYLIINSISFLILVLATIFTGNYAFFLPSITAFLVISVYAVSMTIYLTGLHSNILLYNAKIFLAYTFSISPVLLAMTFVSIIEPYYLLLSPLALPVAYYAIKKAYVKWDSRDYLSF